MAQMQSISESTDYKSTGESTVAVVATESENYSENYNATFVGTRADEIVNKGYLMPLNIYYQASVMRPTDTGWTYSGGAVYGTTMKTNVIIPPGVKVTYRNANPKNDNDTYSWLAGASTEAGYTNELSSDYNYTMYHYNNNYTGYYYPTGLSVNNNLYIPPVRIQRRNKDYTESSNGTTSSYGFMPTPVYYTDPATGETTKIEYSNLSNVDMGNATQMAAWVPTTGNYTDGHPVAECRWFPQPVSPFVLETVNAALVLETIKAGAQYKVKLNKLVPSTTPGKYSVGAEIASTIRTIEEVTAQTWYPEDVALTSKDEFDMDVPVLIDYPFMISYEPLEFAEYYKTFRIAADNYTSSYNDIISADYGDMNWIWMEIYSPSQKSSTWQGKRYTNSTTGAKINQFHITVNGYYPYIAWYKYSATANSIISPLGDDIDWMAKEQKLEIAKTGTNIKLTYATNAEPDEIVITNKDEDDLPDWITASVSPYTEDKFEEGVVLNVEVKALPASVKGREETMKLSFFGVEYFVTFTQGESGVEAVETEAISVKSVNGNFEVVVPASVSNVAVYNVAGQVVANVPVTAGTNTIDGSALANGVYVLKFNNGYTVKAVK